MKIPITLTRYKNLQNKYFFRDIKLGDYMFDYN